MSSGNVRFASDADAAALAELRSRWSPAPQPASLQDDAQFSKLLDDWMIDMGDRSVCAVAEVDGELVGMAWLAIFERVPNPGQPRRLAGDIQSVYVIPEHRGRGLGSQLVSLVIDAADQRGVAKLTADASEDALPLYRRLGFESSDLLLQRRRP